MRIEFVSNGGQDCPAILFHGCPSAGAEALINAFRSLAEGPETELALHQLPGLTPVGDIQVFVTNANGRAGIQQFSALSFRWRQDGEGWLEAAELAEPVARGDAGDKRDFSTLRGTAESMLSLHLTGRGNRLLTHRLGRREI